MKENRRVSMTKNLLKESLLELLKEKSLQKITIKEICENADVNRSTFYLHYADQFALCNEIENDSVEKINDCLVKVSKKENRTQGLSEFLYYMKTNSELFKILFRPDFNNSFRVRFTEIAVKMLAEYDYHDNIPDSEKDYIFRFLFMGTLGMLEKWIENDFDKSPDELAEFIMALMPSITAVRRKMTTIKNAKF